jgi:hypothetical protein
MSPTRAISDTNEKLKAELESGNERIPSLEGQSGQIAFIYGKPVGLDLISQPPVYAELHAQLH